MKPFGGFSLTSALKPPAEKAVPLKGASSEAIGSCAHSLTAPWLCSGFFLPLHGHGLCSSSSHPGLSSGADQSESNAVPLCAMGKSAMGPISY